MTRVRADEHKNEKFVRKEISKEESKVPLKEDIK